jgi:hypothetical protein
MVPPDSLNRSGIACLTSSDEIFRLFLVLLEVGVSGELLAIHHDLPLITAPGVRQSQAERRFAKLAVLRKVGIALSADWLRPSRRWPTYRIPSVKSIGPGLGQSVSSPFAHLSGNGFNALKKRPGLDRSLERHQLPHRSLMELLVEKTTFGSEECERDSIWLHFSNTDDRWRNSAEIN